MTQVERIGRWCRRRPAITALSAGLVLAVLAGFAGTLWQLQQARQNATENVRQIARLTSLITHDGQPVADAAFHPTKDLLATVGRDRRLRVWAVPTGELIFMTDPFDEPPSHVQLADE